MLKQLRQSLKVASQRARLRNSPLRQLSSSSNDHRVDLGQETLASPRKGDEALHNQLRYPDPPTTRHWDLGSFLDYARRSGLDPASTVYVGTHYEYVAANALSKHGFFLKRIGGASDGGTDLIGTWNLSCLPHVIRVLVQCKAGGQQVGPHHVRELEGAFVGAPVGWRGDGVLGVLVSEAPATKGVRDSLCWSRWPLAFVSCSKVGVLQQMLWNRVAQELGLDGLGVSVRHTLDQPASELVMTYNGKPVDAGKRESEPP